MEWQIVVSVLVTLLFTAGIVFVSLWLGWTARDRVGEALKEVSVGPVGLPEIQEPSIMQEDFVAGELNEEDREY